MAHDLTYMWNLLNKTDEQTKVKGLTDTEDRLVIPGAGRETEWKG